MYSRLRPPLASKRVWNSNQRLCVSAFRCVRTCARCVRRYSNRRNEVIHRSCVCRARVFYVLIILFVSRLPLKGSSAWIHGFIRSYKDVVWRGNGSVIIYDLTFNPIRMLDTIGDVKAFIDCLVVLLNGQALDLEACFLWLLIIFITAVLRLVTYQFIIHLR